MPSSQVRTVEKGSFRRHCKTPSVHIHCHFRTNTLPLWPACKCRNHRMETPHYRGGSGMLHWNGSHIAQFPQCFWSNHRGTPQRNNHHSSLHNRCQRNHHRTCTWHQYHLQRYKSHGQSKFFQVLRTDCTGTVDLTSLHRKRKPGRLLEARPRGIVRSTSQPRRI